MRNTYSKFVRTLNQTNFLKNCRDNKVIPKGLQLSFNLAHGNSDTALHINVVQILNEASSRILDELILHGEENQSRTHNLFTEKETNLSDFMGPRAVKNFVSELKLEFTKSATAHKTSLNRKLRALHNVNKNVNTSVNTNHGSVRLIGLSYIKPAISSYVKKSRPHRSIRWKTGRKSKLKSQAVVGKVSPLDLERLNPEVLSESVTLTDIDKSVLRRSDKFAPTPRTPLDVCDLTLGTYRWAESLRWHLFWNNYKKGKLRDKLGYSDLSDKDLEEFEKTPWYRRTDRTAPRIDQDLENFISECQYNFLAPENRRKIKGNFTKQEWDSVIKLRNLPLTHNAACRYSDKSSKTVITDLNKDDELIMTDLDDPTQYDRLVADKSVEIKKTICDFASKWRENGVLEQDQYNYITDLSDTRPGNVKPLFKTHKPKPWPIRLLLSGSNTPVQPLSKFVQFNIRHLTKHLQYQIMDTKDFLQKIEKINASVSSLPQSATIAICDVEKLYPSVNNLMGIPAVRSLLQSFPSPYTPLTECIIEALRICLDCNVCQFTTSDGKTHLRVPNHGTAMGPCHACDYVDVFMGVLDEKTVNESPVQLLTSLMPQGSAPLDKNLSWSRYRDDGFTILLQESDLPVFTNHLQNLHPGIKWVVESGTKMNYLNLTVQLVNGKIHTDEFSKSSHNYLSPDSCHPPSTFKAMLYSKGLQLRMNCSKTTFLKPRLLEYSKYFEAVGWNRDQAYSGLCKGADYNPKETECEANEKRERILFKPRVKKPKKIAWVTNWDPRAPPKPKIINNNIHLLYRNRENMEIFPREMLIGANRRCKNLADFIKPTVPKRFVQHGPRQEAGSFPCEGAKLAPNKTGACDLCKHIKVTKDVKSPYDSRNWKIRQHLTCASKNVIYLIICNHSDHQSNAWYIGSAVEMKSRWRNHRSDFVNKKTNKSGLAGHSCLPHPSVAKSKPIEFFEIILLESLGDNVTEKRLLYREMWWQSNIGTLFFGLNKRKDSRSVSLQTSRLQF